MYMQAVYMYTKCTHSSILGESEYSMFLYIHKREYSCCE